jgi:transposase-like protein
MTRAQSTEFRPQPQRSYGLSYGDLEELLAGHGSTVDGVTIYRWVQTCTPS